jgi:hypothetical protein
MEVEQLGVVLLLQGQRRLERFETASPLVLLRLLHILQDHPAAASVLILHEHHGVLALLLRLLLEPLGDVGQGDVVSVEVEGLEFLIYCDGK